jgi:hypothetical protein
VTQPPADRRPPARPRRLARAGRDRTRPPAHPARHDERRDDLDAYVKRIVDSLPRLTEEQRDLLAMIFRRHRQKLPRHATPSAPPPVSAGRWGARRVPGSLRPVGQAQANGSAFSGLLSSLEMHGATSQGNVVPRSYGVDAG